MASRPFAVSIPVKKSINVDRVVLGVAIACAALSVFLALRTLAPAAPVSVVAEIEAPRPLDLSRFAQK